MTDLEITKLCAEAMGVSVIKTRAYYGSEADSPESLPEHWLQEIGVGEWQQYDPLHDDAQAMALVKKFKLGIGREDGDDMWAVGRIFIETINQDLNRAICECVAKMQGAK